MKVFGFLEKAQAENVAGDLGGTLKGLFWFNTSSNLLKYAEGAAVRTVVNTDGTQTLTNKTLSGNIVANISPDGVNTLTFPASTDTLVGRATTDTLTNKTITAPVINHVVLPHQSTPSTPASGRVLLYSKNDNNLYRLDSDGNEVPVGSSGGGLLNFYAKGDADISKTSDFTTGNNATFGGGGTAQGTLSISTSNPFRGTKSFQYVLNATPGNSDDDYVESESISIPLGYRGRYLHCKLQYSYDGADSDIKWVVKDKTNGVIISIGDEFLEQFVSADNTAKEFNFIFFCPSDCAAISVGPQVLTHTTGSEVLKWDDVVVTPDLYSAKDVVKDIVLEAYGNSGETVTAHVTDFPFNTVLTDKNTQGGWNGSQFTIPEDGVYFIEVGASFSSNLTRLLQLYVNGSHFRDIAFDTINPMNGSYSGYFTKGQVLSIRTDATSTLTNITARNYFNVSAQVTQDHIVTPARASLSDMKDYNPGTINGFTSPTINYCRYREIGDCVEIEARFSTGTVDANEFQWPLPNGYTVSDKYTDTVFVGTLHRSIADNTHFAIIATGGDSFLNASYRYATGTGDILVPKGASTFLNSSESGVTFRAVVKVNELSSQAPLLAALPIGRVAYIKDVKSSGTGGGTFNSGDWRTRDLNTLEGDTSFISLSSNQFTLEPGRYEVDIEAPAYSVNGHKSLLRNITDSLDAIEGTSEYSTSGGYAHNKSRILGSLTLTKKTVFEVRHQCTSTQATNGFGSAVSLGQEVYTQGSIEKVK